LIAKRHEKYVFSFFMSLLMSCLMSLVISIHNVGLVDNIVLVWIRAWIFAFLVAFPTIIMISPVVRKLVDLVVDENA
jgi:hypothetical protein